MPGNSTLGPLDRLRGDLDGLLRSDEQLGTERFFKRLGSLAVANRIGMALGNPEERVAPSPFILLVAGESASGKTTLSATWEDTLQRLGNEKCPDPSGMPWSRYISMDNYYVDNSFERAKYADLGEFYRSFDVDHPGALNLELLRDHLGRLSQGRTVAIPKHDIATGISTMDATPVDAARFIIVEGLFALHPQITDGLEGVAHAGVYVSTSSAEIRRRWFARIGRMADTADWKVPEAERPFYFDRVRTAAEEHVVPTESHADIVINGEAPAAYQQLRLSQLSEIMVDVLKPP